MPPATPEEGVGLTTQLPVLRALRDPRHDLTVLVQAPRHVVLQAQGKRGKIATSIYRITMTGRICCINSALDNLYEAAFFPLLNKAFFVGGGGGGECKYMPNSHKLHTVVF